MKQQLCSPEGIAKINEVMQDNQGLSRHATGVAVCEAFGFTDPLGRLRTSGCLSALLQLHRAGQIALPEARACKPAERRAVAALEPLSDFPDDIRDVSDLRLALVGDETSREIHRRMFENEHPLGAGRLVGRQLRYLIYAGEQPVGGFAFASAALHLEARDRWIGWDAAEQTKWLDHVVCMNRFLIRPTARCRNLATKALSMVEDILSRDFLERYGIEPWLLESFVDLEGHDGAAYRAANWIEVGKTKGRGRQDRHHRQEASAKSIYLRPLVADFRERLGVIEGKGLRPLKVFEDIESEHWGKAEFGAAKAKDARLTARLITIAEDQAAAPGESIATCCGGDWAKTKACYRFLGLPEEGGGMSMEEILEPHRERTIRRMQTERVALCIQDGCELNYSTLDACDGLGSIGSNQTGASTSGLHLHSTLAINTDGVPLGILKADCIAPEPKDSAPKRPKEERKTIEWIEHHRDLAQISKATANTQLVNVLDREADFFDLFDEQRSIGRVDLLVRAKHDRKILNEEQKLFAAVEAEPIATTATITVPRRTGRSKKSKHKAVAKRAQRIATIAVRYRSVTLKPPQNSKAEPVTITIVHAQEVTPPQDEDPLNWYLLTTLSVTNGADALRCIHWYCLRWRIEDWHRVLKSGCRIEKLTLRHADRLRRAIAINMVIAWRIMVLTLLGRTMPELPAEIFFSAIELKVLAEHSKKKTA